MRWRPEPRAPRTSALSLSAMFPARRRSATLPSSRAGSPCPQGRRAESPEPVAEPRGTCSPGRSVPPAHPPACLLRRSGSLCAARRDSCRRMRIPVKPITSRSEATRAVIMLCSDRHRSTRPFARRGRRGVRVHRRARTCRRLPPPCDRSPSQRTRWSVAAFTPTFAKASFIVLLSSSVSSFHHAFSVSTGLRHFHSSCVPPL